MRRFLTAAGGLVLGCAAATSASAAIADFENFVEGNNWLVGFTDPVSGIQFSNPISANSNFVIEFSSATVNRPLTSPGNILGTNGWSPGPGFGLGYQFGYDGLLPTASGSLQMELVYSVNQGSGQVTLTGYNSSNAPVANTSFSTSTGFFLETTLSISSPLNNIQWFRITATNIFDSFDNIRFSPFPEPSVTIACAGMGLAMLRRQRQRRRL